MTDPLARFSNRADNYAKYRPTYPAAVIEILKSDCGLTEAARIADVGSGTGILSEMFLLNGNAVFAIEPNAAMRGMAEQFLSQFPRFTSIDATAETTTLETASVDFITAAQAFHWFDRAKTRREFPRILKSKGWVVLIWNERRLDSTPFLRAYENLLLRYGTDYQAVRHENVAAEITAFYAPETFQLQTIENFQHVDFPALKGRLLSSSYTPEPNHANFNRMLGELEEIFNTHMRKGLVCFEYETRIYYGPLPL